MNTKDSIRATAPNFLLLSSEKWWRCRTKQEVIALAFKRVTDTTRGRAAETEILLLQKIHETPEAILKHILSVHPRFQKQLSKTTGTAYYMNLCKCGANFGDHYPFSELGGA